MPFAIDQIFILIGPRLEKNRCQPTLAAAIAVIAEGHRLPIVEITGNLNLGIVWRIQKKMDLPQLVRLG